MGSSLLIKDISDFEKLVNTYTNKLTQAAFIKIGNLQDSEDLVQDLFLSLWIKRESLIVFGSVQNYLFVALRNKIMNYFTKKKHLQLVKERLESTLKIVDSSLIDFIVEKDISTSILEILAELPVNMQKIYKLRNENFSLREIADILGLAEQTVKGYSAELHRKIKAKLIARYPDFTRSLSTIIPFLLLH